MPNTGLYPTATGETIGGVAVAWSDPTNIQTEADTQATAALTGGQTTNLLRATNFDFTRLDSADSIVGITVEILVGLSVGANSDGGLTVVQLVLATNNVGDDQISGTQNLLAAYTLLRFGASNNLWGATPSIDNAQTSTFGVNIVAAQVANTPTIAVRHVRMAIHVANSQTVIASRARSLVRSR